MCVEEANRLSRQHIENAGSDEAILPRHSRQVIDKAKVIENSKKAESARQAANLQRDVKNEV
jgi:hypothetical protein